MYEVNNELMQTLGIEDGAFAGRLALVTGSARGIGEATAVNLAHLGARVVILDILESGREVADRINRDGGEATFVRCDLSDVAQLEAVIEQVTSATVSDVGSIHRFSHTQRSVAAPMGGAAVQSWHAVDYGRYARCVASLLNTSQPLTASLQQEADRVSTLSDD